MIYYTVYNNINTTIYTTVYYTVYNNISTTIYNIENQQEMTV